MLSRVKSIRVNILIDKVSIEEYIKEGPEELRQYIARLEGKDES